MFPRTVRPLAATAAVLAAGGLSLTGAQSAFAAPGDNGDVKIHQVGTAFDSQKDEPKVCKFYLVGFNFDVLPQVAWQIVPQPPKVDAPQLSGVVTLAVGTGHTAPLALPDGEYKLTWAGKQKIFRVDCAGNEPGKPPHGPVGAGGGGSAEIAAEDSSGSGFGIGAAVAAGLAGLTGLVLIRRSRRRDDGVA